MAYVRIFLSYSLPRKLRACRIICHIAKKTFSCRNPIQQNKTVTERRLILTLPTLWCIPIYDGYGIRMHYIEQL